MTKIALTITGFDSDRGARVQADLWTFALHCIYANLVFFA